MVAASNRHYWTAAMSNGRRLTLVVIAMLLVLALAAFAALWFSFRRNWARNRNGMEVAMEFSRDR